MKPLNIDVSYSDIELACRNLSNAIIEDGYEFDYIIGLTRGGLLPAVLMSNLLKLPMIGVEYSSKDGNGEAKNHSNDITYISKHIYPNKLIRKVLVVDDIADTGLTLFELVQELQDLNFEVVTCSIFYKETSIIKPDYYNSFLKHDAGWVIFPWEIN